jgi:hypothetical protein
VLFNRRGKDREGVRWEKEEEGGRWREREKEFK